MIDEKPKRLWFRFSLRTLFVVMTVIAIYLGWQASIVHERKALIAEGEERGSWSPYYFDEAQRWSVRTLMGDRQVKYFSKNRGDFTREETSRLHKVFPEAKYLSLVAPGCGGWDEETVADQYEAMGIQGSTKPM